VRFLLAYNRKENLRFAPLQSEKTKALLRELNWKGKTMDSLIFIENRKTYTKSEAVFRISKHLTYPWKAIFHFKHLPKGFCDRLYNFIAKNRYSWFGKKQSCMMPRPEWTDRFL
jgi:predicted DCC family thiol-disulfide oxidoreductase YuxK